MCRSPQSPLPLESPIPITSSPIPRSASRRNTPFCLEAPGKTTQLGGTLTSQPSGLGRAQRGPSLAITRTQPAQSPCWSHGSSVVRPSSSFTMTDTPRTRDTNLSTPMSVQLSKSAWKRCVWSRKVTSRTAFNSNKQSRGGSSEHGRSVHAPIVPPSLALRWQSDYSLVAAACEWFLVALPGAVPLMQR
jgi:hypothetical protein